MSKTSRKSHRLNPRMRRKLTNTFWSTTEDNERMVRIVDKREQGTKDVVLDREPASNFRREVFEKYPNLHFDILSERLATAMMCHVSSEMVSLLVKPANHFTGAKPFEVNQAAISWARK